MTALHLVVGYIVFGVIAAGGFYIGVAYESYRNEEVDG
jgi:hypothetical protein